MRLIFNLNMFIKMIKKNLIKIDCYKMKIFLKIEVDCMSLSVFWLCVFIYKWGWNGNIFYKCLLY